MKDQPDSVQFIHIDKKLINLRFVKMMELTGTTLGVTVPGEEGEITYMLHDNAPAVFEKLKRNSVNYGT